MSLVVWLPLTKDLRQQGLSDVEAINNGATYSSTGGKLGGCYSFTTSSYQKIGFPYSLANYTEFTVCVWVKPISTTITGCLFTFVNPNDYWQFVITNGNNVGIRDNSSGEAGSRKEYTLGSFVANVWTHLAISYDKGVVKIYKDGVLFSTNNTGGSAMNNYSGTNAAIGESMVSSSSYYFAGSVNDFRIYDHCLSPMEVKQISQGLVLHYPLNREGWGQENLMPNSTIMSVGSANASTGSWRVAGSSQMTRSRVAISDSPIGDVYGCQSVGLQTGQDASCWGIDSFPRENGTTYTISAWGRIVGGSSTAAMLGFSVYSGTTLDYGGTYGQAKSSDTKYYGSGAYDYAGGQLNPNGNWTRIYRTFTSTSASDNIYIGFNTAKTGNSVTLQLCGVKLEKGDKVTSWCPKSTDDLADVIGLNENIEYDTSGFCNNGEKIGTFTYTSDTPKYAVSTHLDTTTTKIHISNFPTSGFSNSYTFAWWAKISSITPMHWGFSDGIRLNGMYTGRLWNTGDGSNNPLYNIGTTTQVTAPTVNVWHHWVMTGNGTKCYVYQDGELWGEAKTYKSISGTSIYINGWANNADYSSNNYSISDFRVYATALSADDVRALYENSAYIDNSGNTYAATYTEV